MTGKGHTICGIVSGIAPASAAYVAGGFIPAIAAWAFTIAGSTAPDWLEFPKEVRKKINGKTTTVLVRRIPHRTITHTIIAWAFATFFFYISLAGTHAYGIPHLLPIISAIGLGFSYGGVVHLIGDLPNKQRIPIFTRFDGISLNLWKSGEFEKTLAVICGAISLYLAICIFNNITPIELFHDLKGLLIMN
ncbi:metal-dependent hydrolase [Photobacterium damselae]|uniref:metal-dependent hydrolase n=1 Tax=Photobacterium damselae TaxID=38293 RepID=UPI001F32FFA1|nr:metal-dependent hydrolase [Photobacterium damselae]UKA04592.1 metal-dependent hydrolase [Photobacterium damselae subsp. damselae]